MNDVRGLRSALVTACPARLSQGASQVAPLSSFRVTAPGASESDSMLKLILPLQL